MVSLRTAIELAADERGLSEDACFALKVAATEAVANAFHHAEDGDRGVSVAIVSEDGGVQVEILSHGPFRIANALDPERGRGLPLIVALSDTTEFERDERSTCVRIRKHGARAQQPTFA